MAAGVSKERRMGGSIPSLLLALLPSAKGARSLASSSVVCGMSWTLGSPKGKADRCLGSPDPLGNEVVEPVFLWGRRAGGCWVGVSPSI